jgi:hypothetical protein
LQLASLVQVEPAACGLDDGRVYLDHVGHYAGVLLGYVLGKREAATAYSKDPLDIWREVEDAAKSAVVCKRRVHAAWAEESGGLPDAAGTEDSLPYAVRVRRVDKGEAGLRAHCVGEKLGGGGEVAVWAVCHARLPLVDACVGSP